MPYIIKTTSETTKIHVNGSLNSRNNGIWKSAIPEVGNNVIKDNLLSENSKPSDKISRSLK